MKSKSLHGGDRGRDILGTDHVSLEERSQMYLC